MKIEYCKCEKPIIEKEYNYVELTDETMKQRLSNIKAKMLEKNLDSLVIYGDREHGSNFEYLTGFIPRFEEALLVINKNNNYLLLGNENMKMAAKARIENTVIHVPYFSLPNQPMEDDCGLIEPLIKARINKDFKVGTVGWKVFASKIQNNRKIFELPSLIIESLKEIVSDGSLENHSDLFLKEVRSIKNANEVAHYAYGVALSSNAILNIYENIELGKTDTKMAYYLEVNGQPNSVTTIFALGERYINANLYPREKVIKTGDKISVIVHKTDQCHA